MSAGYHIVHGRAERIYIRPRTLLAGLIVLLCRREAGLENDGQILGVVGGKSRRAEVDKLYISVVAQKNIIGAYIAVDYIVLMRLFEGVDNAENYFYTFVNRKLLAVFSHIIAESAAVKIFHDDIGGVVLLYVPVDVDNVRMRIKLRHVPRLVDKPFETHFNLAPASVGEENKLARIGGSVDRADRIVFLYCD